MRPLIIIFAKAPVAGRAKTRLDADPSRAAALHSIFVRDALAMAETLRDEADVELSTDTPSDAWPESAVRRSLQAEGNLGERMYAALEQALSAGRSKGRNLDNTRTEQALYMVAHARIHDGQLVEYVRMKEWHLPDTGSEGRPIADPAKTN